MAALLSLAVPDPPANEYAARRYVDDASRPPAIVELNSLGAESVKIHELIFLLHRQLALSGGDSEESRRLLHESSRIAVSVIPDVMTKAKRLASSWERAGLDPRSSRELGDELTQVIEGIRPVIHVALDRQVEIVRALESLTAVRAD